MILLFDGTYYFSLDLPIHHGSPWALPRIAPGHAVGASGRLCVSFRGHFSVRFRGRCCGRLRGLPWVLPWGILLVLKLYRGMS